MRKPSPATAIATVALFVALGGVGVAATGGNFILGQSNSANKTSTLASGVTTGPTLELSNSGGSPAARFKTPSGVAPFVVDSGKKVTNLNADKLDDLDSGAFARARPPSWNIVSGTTQSNVLAVGKFVCYPEGSSYQYDECWMNYGSSLSTAAYAKDAFGFVHLKGVVKCPPASGTSFGSRPCEKADPTNVIFVLPIGYRPAETSVFSTVSNNAFGRITVDASGKVIAEVGDVYTLDNDGWIALDGITFRAA
jgi:hypothetical protein